VDRLRWLISESTGNLDVDRSVMQSSLSSATALSQLIERAEARSASKRLERANAYSRLYRLIDATALEFRDEGASFISTSTPPAGVSRVDARWTRGRGAQERVVHPFGARAVLAPDVTQANWPWPSN
jgi:hypothetical protein